MKRIVISTLLLTVMACLLISCDTKTTSVEEPVDRLKDVNPVYARLIANGRLTISLFDLQYLLGTQISDTAYPADAMSANLRAWKEELNLVTSNTTIKDKITALNVFMFQTKNTKVVQASTSEECFAGHVFKAGQGSDLAVSLVYADLANTIQLNASVVEWPGGFGVLVTSREKEYFIAIAEAGYVYSRAGLQQRFNDDMRYNISSAEMVQEYYLESLSDIQLSSRLFSTLGASLAQAKQDQLAFDYLSAAIIVDAENRSAIHARGDWYMQQNNIHMAIYDYKTALRQNVQFAYSHLKLGLAFLEIDDNAAVKSLKQAIEIKGNCVEAIDGLAQAYTRLDKFKMAEELYLSALKLQPGHPILLSHTADLYFAAKDYANASKYYDMAITKAAATTDSYVKLALCYQHLAKHDQALATYNLAIAKAPTNLNLRYYRAGLYVSMKRYTEAMTDYKTILSYSSDAGKLNERIADTAMLAKDYPTALSYYQSAVRIQQNAMTLHYKTARVHGFMHNHKDAIKWLRSAHRENFNDFNKVTLDPAFTTLLKETPLAVIFQK